MFTALAIAIHNFPEGLATFAAALSDPALGLSIAVAIAIHNIPEGISVSVPIYFATGSKIKAFWYSFLSGLSEPVGALRRATQRLSEGELSARVGGRVVTRRDEIGGLARDFDAMAKAQEKYRDRPLSSLKLPVYAVTKIGFQMAIAVRLMLPP